MTRQTAAQHRLKSFSQIKPTAQPMSQVNAPRAPAAEQPTIELEREPDTKGRQVATMSPKSSDEKWFEACLKRGRDEIFLAQRELTEALARMILDRNPDNRRSSRSVVKKYVEEMQAGDFDSLNGETIQISREGLTNNGQGRCEAVLLSGVILPFLFIFGLRREARLTVDQGRRRTGADYLDMRGIQGTRDAVGVAQMLHQFRRHGQLTRATDARLSASQVAHYAEEHFAEISEALHFIPRTGASQVGGVPFLAFALMVLRGTDSQEAAIQFITDLVRGSNLEPNSPILILRNRLVADRRLSRAEKLELIIKAWNAHRTGQSVYRLGLTGKMPEIAA